MTTVQWEPGDDPTLFIETTPRHIDDRTRPVDPVLIDRFALALARRPWVIGVLVTEDENGRCVHAALDAPDHAAKAVADWMRRLLKPLGLRAPVTWSSGPACWSLSPGWTVGPILPDRWATGDGR